MLHNVTLCKFIIYIIAKCLICFFKFGIVWVKRSFENDLFVKDVSLNEQKKEYVTKPTKNEIEEFINKKFNINSKVIFLDEEANKELGFSCLKIDWDNKLLRFIFGEYHDLYYLEDIKNEIDYEKNEIIYFNKDLSKYVDKYIDVLNYSHNGIDVVDGKAKFLFDGKEYLTDNFYFSYLEANYNNYFDIYSYSKRGNEYKINIIPLDDLIELDNNILNDIQLNNKIEKLKKDNISNIEKKKDLLNKLEIKN